MAVEALLEEDALGGGAGSDARSEERQPAAARAATTLRFPKLGEKGSMKFLVYNI
jgi:hypothetical protein